jgi:hypothetical protein
VYYTTRVVLVVVRVSERVSVFVRGTRDAKSGPRSSHAHDSRSRETNDAGRALEQTQCVERIAAKTLYLQLSTDKSPLAQVANCATVQAATSVAVAEQEVWLQSQLFRMESKQHLFPVVGAGHWSSLVPDGRRVARMEVLSQKQRPRDVSSTQLNDSHVQKKLPLQQLPLSEAPFVTEVLLQVEGSEVPGSPAIHVHPVGRVEHATELVPPVSAARTSSTARVSSMPAMLSSFAVVEPSGCVAVALSEVVTWLLSGVGTTAVSAFGALPLSGVVGVEPPSELLHPGNPTRLKKRARTNEANIAFLCISSAYASCDSVSKSMDSPGSFAGG